MVNFHTAVLMHQQPMNMMPCTLSQQHEFIADLKGKMPISKGYILRAWLWHKGFRNGAVARGILETKRSGRCATCKKCITLA
jgi:hypothetical protein